MKRINEEAYKKMKEYCDQFIPDDIDDIDDDDIVDDEEYIYDFKIANTIRMIDDLEENGVKDLFHENFIKMGVSRRNDICLFRFVFSIKVDWDELTYVLKNYKSYNYSISNKDELCEHPGRWKDYSGSWEDYKNDYEDWESDKDDYHVYYGNELVEEFEVKYRANPFDLIKIINFRKFLR